MVAMVRCRDVGNKDEKSGESAVLLMNMRDVFKSVDESVCDVGEERMRMEMCER
jgi:hypothetical protein